MLIVKIITGMETIFSAIFEYTWEEVSAIGFLGHECISWLFFRGT